MNPLKPKGVWFKPPPLLTNTFFCKNERGGVERLGGGAFDGEGFKGGGGGGGGCLIGV